MPRMVRVDTASGGEEVGTVQLGDEYKAEVCVLTSKSRPLDYPRMVWCAKSAKGRDRGSPHFFITIAREGNGR